MQNTFHPQTAKFVGTVATCMPPGMPTSVMQFWIMRPDLLQESLARLRSPAASGRFETWQTLELGSWSPESLCKELERAGYLADEHRDTIIAQALSPYERTTVNLARVATCQLDLVKDEVREEEIWQRLNEFGFQPCPGEVGPLLRLILKDQSVGYTIITWMKPMQDPDGDDAFFALTNDGFSRGLSLRKLKPDSIIRNGNGIQIVAVLPKAD